MRPHAPLLGAALTLGALTSVVLAQPRPGPRPPVRGDAGAPARDAAVRDAAVRDAAVRDAAVRPASPVDAGAANADAAAPVASGDAGAVTVGDAAYPMRQIGTGTVVHFPIPEQFARTGVPVFVQVRSSAPIDHVSLFFRGLGARRYTEVRMTAMGQQFRLGSGFGAMVPCEDVFPPKVQYYVEAIDQSGAPNGRAGSADAPVEIPVVDVRRYPAPTLPGQPPPPTCGAMTTGASARDAGAASNEPPRGSADLGEPCQATTDCRRGLRCGAHHQCVFETPR